MATSKKPNILFIMADQMAAPLLSLYNSNSPIKTPNLDKLAQAGVVFESAYCNSPLCAPSRFTLATGQLPSKIGGFDNASDLAADIPTYAHYLRKEGYHTALSGKMHFVGPDQLHGYEQRLTGDIYPGDYGWTVNWDDPEVRPDWYHNMSSVTDAGTCVRTNQLDYDDEVIYKATRYLYDHVRHREDQPFCLTVSMTHPHDPYAATQDLWDRYEDVDIPLPTTAAIPHEQQDPHSQRVLKCIDLYGKELSDERIRAARRAYFAACSYVDDQIGKLLHTLNACGLADDTIIFFSGDHGDMLGERGLWYKMVWFEMSARVPMLVYAPGRFAPGRVRENVSTMDLLPTFVEMTGGTVDPRLPMDGVSLMPYLTPGFVGVKADTVLGEYMAEGTLAPVVMIRRGRWKFIYSPLDPPMLFDVVADPHESVNLAADSGLQSFPSTLNSSGPTTTIPRLASSDTKPTFIPTQFYPASLPTPGPSPDPEGVAAASRPLTLTPNSSPSSAASSRSPSNISTFSSSSTSTSASTPSTTSTLLAQFLAEVHSRWDFASLTQAVLNSQRRRRLVYSALTLGVPAIWDYAPVEDPSAVYVRNQGKRALEDLEWKNRYPRVAK